MPEGPRVRAALFVVREDRLLLAEHRKDGRTYYLLPGGGVDEGESWPEAAAREVREELGAPATAGALLAVFENRSPDGARHILHAILAGSVEGEPAATGQDERVVGCRWVSARDLRELEIMPAIGPVLTRWLEQGPPGGAECARIEWVDG